MDRQTDVDVIQTDAYTHARTHARMYHVREVAQGPPEPLDFKGLVHEAKVGLEPVMADIVAA